MNFPAAGRLPWLPHSCAAFLLLGLSGCGGGGSGGESSTTAPVAPSGVFANPEVTGADVGWIPAADAAKVASYRISASAAGQPTVSANASAGATGASLTGLVEDLDYSVTVQAVAANGLASPLSDAATVHVPRLTNTVAETLNFNAAASYSQNHTGDAVLIMRDGQVVFERFPGSYAKADNHPLASGSKSFSCAFMLSAQTDGFVTLDQKVSDVLTEWKSDPNKSLGTVRQLLSLQSGLSTNPDYSPANVDQLDTYQLALDDPANYPPGQAFIYDPLAFQAFALMFQRKASNRDPIDYLQARVLAPIGLTGFAWQRDEVGHPQMAGGASMTAPMWAKYGQLFLQKGTWQSTRVLPADGANECVTYSNPAYLGYGITWWLNRPVGDTYDPTVDKIPADGVAGSSGQIAPRAPADMYMAAGTGHQRLYILPSLRMVVVRLAPLSTETDDWSDDEFLGALLGT